MDNDIELRVANNRLRFDGTYLPSPVVYSQHLLPEKKGVDIIIFFPALEIFQCEQ